MKNFVIAGKISEAIDWLNRNNMSSKDWRYLSDIDFLRGLSEVHGVFIGTWKERNDMSEIFSVLFSMCQNNTGVALAHLEYQIHLKLQESKNASIKFQHSPYVVV